MAPKLSVSTAHRFPSIPTQDYPHHSNILDTPHRAETGELSRGNDHVTLLSRYPPPAFPPTCLQPHFQSASDPNAISRSKSNKEGKRGRGLRMARLTNCSHGLPRRQHGDRAGVHHPQPFYAAEKPSVGVHHRFWIIGAAHLA